MQEQQIVKYILDMETMLMGLTCEEVRKIAYQLAVKSKIPHPFNNEEQMAGKDWLYGFFQRFPQLSIRKPENTSAVRARGFNKAAVSEFFNILQDVMKKYNFPASRIWNVDETGISVVPKSVSKIIALKGRKQVGAYAAAERGELVTAEICMSASGVYMPPMLIIPRVRANPKYERGKPEGGWVEYSPNGWIQSEIFLRWLKKFIEFSTASIEHPVLLILDGHATHVKSIEVIDMSMENGVVILCFPPHTTHRLQPLDVGFMKPLSNYYSSEIRQWNRSHIGSVLGIADIFSVFTPAYLKACTSETAVNSFRKTGIHPYNPKVFKESDFAAAHIDIVGDDEEINNESQEESGEFTTF